MCRTLPHTSARHGCERSTTPPCCAQGKQPTGSSSSERKMYFQTSSGCHPHRQTREQTTCLSGELYCPLPTPSGNNTDRETDGTASATCAPPTNPQPRCPPTRQTPTTPSRGSTATQAARRSSSHHRTPTSQMRTRGREAVEKAVRKEEFQEIKKEARKTLQGTTISHPKLKGKIKISRRSIDEWTNQPHIHYQEKNLMILSIGKVLQNAKYLGKKTDVSQKAGTKFVHIFEIEIKADKSWIIVKEYQDGSIMLYSVSDSPNVLIGLNKK